MKGITYFVQAIFPCVLLSTSILTNAQNKYGQTMLLNTQGLMAAFTDTARPTVRKTATMPMGVFWNELSNICDSLTGQPLFYFNGKRIFDTLGNVMDNGAYLQDSSVYGINNIDVVTATQGTLILPKGNNQYYAFATMVSDSMVQNCWFTPCSSEDYYDDFRYHIVDMNMNAGAGKVVAKNKKLLYHVPLNRTQMMACRHANGKDWWLFKCGYDTNAIYLFRVTQDSIYGPFVHHTTYTFSSKNEYAGQISFGRNGTKYAAVLGTNNILLMADFDRCTGLISNERYYHIPIDSSTILNNPNILFDSSSTGVCFSPNGQFVYISKGYNVYQFEFGEEDSSLAWFRVKHGPDTIWPHHVKYGQLANAPDGRIYVGKFGGSAYPSINNVIDHPDVKGVGCGWCNRCFRGDPSVNYVAHLSFANMPDYNLGPTNNPNCWPLANNELVGSDKELAIYPNPADRVVYIKNRQGCTKKLYNYTGQLVLTSSQNELDVSKLIKGLYYVVVNGEAKKLLIE